MVLVGWGCGAFVTWRARRFEKQLVELDHIAVGIANKTDHPSPSDLQRSFGDGNPQLAHPRHDLRQAIDDQRQVRDPRQSHRLIQQHVVGSLLRRRVVDEVDAHSARRHHAQGAVLFPLFLGL